MELWIGCWIYASDNRLHENAADLVLNFGCSWDTSTGSTLHAIMFKAYWRMETASYTLTTPGILENWITVDVEYWKCCT